MYINIRKTAVATWSAILIILLSIIAVTYFKTNEIKFGKKISKQIQPELIGGIILIIIGFKVLLTA